MARADEAGYVFRGTSPERAGVYRRLEAAAEARRGMPGTLLDLPYGPHPAERFDLFPGSAGAPAVVFFHGGYWQSHDKARYSGIATALNARGLSAAVVGYPLAPAVRPKRIVDCAAASVSPVLSALSALSGTPRGWLVAGHSAGAHLACFALGAPGVPLRPAGAVLLSGVYDLRPLVGTSLNRALRLREAEAARLSPMWAPPVAPAVRLFVGGAETEALQTQSWDFLSSIVSAGRIARLEVCPGATHYSILEELLDARSGIVEAIAEIAAPLAQAVR